LSRTRKLLTSAIVLGATGAVAGAGTFSAFTSTTSNPSNEFKAGTVTLTDNDLGVSALTLSNAMPGASTTGCIQVTYSGSLASTVKLYASVSGSLAPYLDLTVTRGTESAPSFPSCSTFSADSTNYIGQGPGVLFSGKLDTYPTTYAAGVADAAGAAWNNNNAHSYKLQVTLPSNAASAAQGLSSTASFTWEARNQ
jgi:predicted ribosomally synthesized peptide with SipW-like signal peptide